MINRINSEKLNAVMRLFTIYAEQGHQKDDAISKSEAKLGAGYSKELEILRHVFSEGSSSTNNTRKQRQSFFESLKSDITSSGGDESKALMEVSKLMRITSGGFKACARFYQAIYTYPIIIIAIAMLIYTQYKLFVFESIESIFNDNGVLPQLSQFVFSDLTSIVLLVIVILVAIFFIKTILTLKRDFALFKPNNSWFSKKLFSGNDQNYLLFLLYLKTLLICGSDTKQSIEKSKRYAGISDKNSVKGYQAKQDILTAVSSESNGVISSEVDFQLHAVVDEMENKLISKQENILVFFQLLTFIFVGTMIIAMYLPVFKLASIFS